MSVLVFQFIPTSILLVSEFHKVILLNDGDSHELLPMLSAFTGSLIWTKPSLIGVFTSSWLVQPNFGCTLESRETFLKGRELTMSSNSLKIFHGSSVPLWEKWSNFIHFFFFFTASSSASFFSQVSHYFCKKSFAPGMLNTCSFSYIPVLCIRRLPCLGFSVHALSTKLIAFVLAMSVRTAMLHPSGMTLIQWYEYTLCVHMSYLH